MSESFLEEEITGVIDFRSVKANELSKKCPQ
jgi:hypothetical protein